MKKPVLICKVGTVALTRSNGDVEEETLEEICQQLAQLHTRYDLILVSSGAVGLGRKFLAHFSGSITERKAAASIGNPILIQKYAHYFKSLGISVAQALCERSHFSRREQFVQLKDTFEELWKQKIIPVVNENDVISNRELKFSDNDELATLLAVGFSADKLLLGTVKDGLMDGDRLITKIDQFGEHVFSLVKKETSEAGLGGMLSKLHCARLATGFGVSTVIFDIRKKGNILLAEREKTGTCCSARVCNISAHKKWMATGSLSTGKVIVDKGAQEALQRRKSLLLVGVKSIEGDFEKGDILKIAIKNQEGNREVFAVAQAKISSHEIKTLKDKKDIEIAHADEIVLF